MTDSRSEGPRPAFLVFERITKQFGDTVANKNVSITIQAGEVHALLGENGAGKSTLMRIGAGLLQPDVGRILVHGEIQSLVSPKVARRMGIGMVHQNFTLVPTLTVVENVVLGRSLRGLYLNLSRPVQRIRRLIEAYGLSIEPQSLIEHLSGGEQQRVEILKLLDQDPNILLLDEPTSLLTPVETAQLFKLMRRWAYEGRAVVFSTHKLREVSEVADRITVLRKGQVVSTLPAADADDVKLTRLMVGRDLPRTNEALKASTVGKGDRAEPCVRIRDLEAIGDSGHVQVRSLSLDLYPGEIVGVAGIEGNGQRELAEVLVGLRSPSRGTVSLFGRSVRGMAVGEIAELGLRYVPDDRRGAGVVLNLSVLDNLFLSPIDRRAILGGRVLRRARLVPSATDLMTEYQIRGCELESPTRLLSGGNQQKVVLARELRGKPRILVASQPTQGLDVAATAFVQQLMRSHRDRGAAILYISSDLDELLLLSDRIVVLLRGSIVHDVPGREANRERIGRLMTGLNPATELERPRPGGTE